MLRCGLLSLYVEFIVLKKSLQKFRHIFVSGMLFLSIACFGLFDCTKFKNLIWRGGISLSPHLRETKVIAVRFKVAKGGISSSLWHSISIAVSLHIGVPKHYWLRMCGLQQWSEKVSFFSDGIGCAGENKVVCTQTLQSASVLGGLFLTAMHHVLMIS